MQLDTGFLFLLQITWIFTENQKDQMKNLWESVQSATENAVLYGQRDIRQIPVCKMEIQMRQIILYKGEDGFWVVECPSLPGCISQGKTREEAIANIREAIAGYILVMQEDGLPVPEDHLDRMLIAI